MSTNAEVWAAVAEYQGACINGSTRMRWDAERDLRALTPPVESEYTRALARFGAACLKGYWNDANPGDLDGGDVEQWALEYDLLVPIQHNTPHGDGCDGYVNSDGMPSCGCLQFAPGLTDAMREVEP